MNAQYTMTIVGHLHAPVKKPCIRVIRGLLAASVERAILRGNSTFAAPVYGTDP